MEISQWLSSAPIVNIMQSIFSLLKLAPKQDTDGGSKDAAIATAPSTLNYNGTMKDVEIVWKSETQDGLLGQIWMDGTLVCNSITNKSLRILDGVYLAQIDFSPHLQYRCPHLRVPLRDSQAPTQDAGLRIHVANEPCQSEGCIFPGQSLESDAVDNSKAAFDSLMLLLPLDGVFRVSIQTSLAS